MYIWLLPIVLHRSGKLLYSSAVDCEHQAVAWQEPQRDLQLSLCTASRHVGDSLPELSGIALSPWPASAGAPAVLVRPLHDNL